MIIDWRYGFGEYKGVSRRRIARLFRVGSETRWICRRRGALVPPLGRFLSTYVPSCYFLVQRLFPPVVGQMTTILQKTAVEVA